MNTLQEAYATVGRLTYVINKAHNICGTPKYVWVDLDHDDHIFISVREGEETIKRLSTSDIYEAISLLSDVAVDANAELSKTEYKERMNVARFVARARELAQKDGFDLTQESWDAIFNECMDNYKKLEEM